MASRQQSAGTDPAARLKAIEDRLAIMDTMYTYAHSIDYGRKADFLDCFTVDGVIEHRWRGQGKEDHHEGRVALAKHFADIAPLKRWQKHLLLNPLIKVNGNTASAESFWVFLRDAEGAPIVRSFGRYRDLLVKGRDGKWRLRERIIEPEARAGYSARMASMLQAQGR
ncbi:MAG: nuclear transport factor 2 family protein [Chloroflexi bacterium]|nr:nuclear transport factor 2 family protein [Chloroflexota bacterium]